MKSETPKHLRPIYEDLGVDKYYSLYGDAYENPHLPQIQALLAQNKENMDLSHVLDFGAGGGEITLELQKWGVAQITACDPYTYRLYQKKTGLPCKNWSFKGVINGQIKGDFSVIIASFALHLCPEAELHALVKKLFKHTKQLVVLTPHKRPQLEEFKGINLDFEDFALTEKGKKVFLRSYSCIWNS